MNTQLKSKTETGRNSKFDLKLIVYAIAVVSIAASFAVILRFEFHLV